MPVATLVPRIRKVKQLTGALAFDESWVESEPYGRAIHVIVKRVECA